MDTISRQAAYKTLTEYYHHTTEIQHKALREALERVPTAQPETHEERTETHACDLISRRAAIDAVYKCADIFAGDMPVMVVKSDAYEALAQLPSAQPDSKETSSTHKALDTISRQAAIDVCNKAIDLWQGQLGEGIVIAVRKKIEELPSAQPELPEWVQKVEEYRKSAPSFVRNQLVWALYQTWKEYDGRLVHQRGKENR